MRRVWSTVYAVICTVLLAGGFLVTFYFSHTYGIDAQIECIIGLCMGFVFAPIVHELGHIGMAKVKNMRVVYAKFFCFKLRREKGKTKFSFASPFTADETQSLPQSGGDMQKRASLYTLGGLLFGGVFLMLILAAAIVVTCVATPNFELWGLVPYSAYLVLLNAMPLEYASGKTDMLVYAGIKRGDAAEKNMLSAMEIQGELCEGKSFSEIDEHWYFDVPQLAEDEPLYAVMLDLRYRYHLENNELEKAGDCLNRLYGSRAYLPEVEFVKVAAEFVYMHSLRGDLERAEECGSVCREYLQGDAATAKRILAAFSAAFGKTEEAKILVGQAKTALEKEEIPGVKKFEEILLSRIVEA